MPYPNYILDVNAGGGEDYVSIVTAEADMQGDFDNTQPVTLSCRAGTEILADSLTWTGWTTPTGGNTVTIQNAVGAEHGGVIGGPSYIMQMDLGFKDLFVIEVDLMHIKGIQTRMNHPSSNTHFVANGGLQNHFTDVITRYTGNENRTAAYAFRRPSTLRNCVYYADGLSQTGVSTTGTTVENCTLVANTSSPTGTIGFDRGSGAGLLRNNVVVGFATCIGPGHSASSISNATSDTTASDYLDGQTGVVLTTGVDFVDAANADLNPEPLGKLDSNGVDITETSPDVAGNTRTSPWEIGAWEIAGSGPIDSNLLEGGMFTTTGAALIEEMYVKDGGIWVKYKPYVKDTGAWVETKAYVKEAGVWVQVYGEP